MKNQIAGFLAVSVLLLIGVGQCSAATNECLRGLPSVYVAVNEEQSLLDAGVDKSAILASVEQRLRAAGITLYDDSNLAQAANKKPFPVTLFVDVDGFKSDPPQDFYCFRVKAALVDDVQLARSPAVTFEAETWHKDVFGMAGPAHLDTIKKQVEDRADEFVSDYLAANPKSAPGL